MNFMRHRSGNNSNNVLLCSLCYDNEVKFYIKAHIISILNVFTILFYHFRITSSLSSKFVANEKNIIKFSLSEKATKLFRVIFHLVLTLIPSSKFVENFGKWKKYHKVQSFWKGHKILKKISQLYMYVTYYLRKYCGLLRISAL